MIASEASCERVFSQQKMVHTDVRNRLGADQVQAEITIRGRVGHTKRVRDDRDNVTDICTTEHAILFVKLYRLRMALKRIENKPKNYYQQVTIKENRESEWSRKSGCVSVEKYCHAPTIADEHQGLQHLKVGSTYYLVATKGFDFKNLSNH
eukprot:PhF_6_TR3469/c0_g3_i3/m.5081